MRWYSPRHENVQEGNRLKLPSWSRIAELLRIARSCISIKGKTNEGMGWIGRGEGLAAMAVVLLDQIGDIDTLHASIRTGG